MQAFCRGTHGEPTAATILAASNLDAVTFGRGHPQQVRKRLCSVVTRWKQRT